MTKGLVIALLLKILMATSSRFLKVITELQVMAPSTGVDSFLLHHHPEKMFLELEPL
jgi:hypothetical protein